MNVFINYLKALAIPLASSIIIPLLLGIFNLMGLKTSNIVVLVLMIITMLISGFFIGKNAQKKGYINGLIFGFITSLIFFIISLIFRSTYGINTIIYYAIIIAASTIGSMIGIQKKTNE